MKHYHIFYSTALFAFILTSPVQAGLVVHVGQAQLAVSNDFL